MFETEGWWCCLFETEGVVLFVLKWVVGSIVYLVAGGMVLGEEGGYGVVVDRWGLLW